jgi:streptogramin lyase/tRNA A-37 threonylcarbamoyl transferase component Bud32
VSVHTDPRIGSELVGYAIEERVGRGGMGVVYRAYDRRLKRKVALKLVAPELAADERFRERFLRESELAISLEHPSVVPIHDAGEVDGQLYLAMRYVEGSDLGTLLESDGALAPSRAISICAQVAEALDAAHARGLVHRDVKPSNVLLDTSEHAYLADFGLSRRLADEGVSFVDARSLGTPAYVAPEQIEGARIDGRADVYSLGCLLFECLTGEPPFTDGSRLAVVWAHLEEEVPSASERNAALPEAIDPVLRKAMAKNPQERFASCSELVSAAGDALGLREVAGVRGRRPLLLAGAGVLVAVVAVAAFVASRGDGDPRGPGLAVGTDTVVRIDPKTNRLAGVTDVRGDPSAVTVSRRSVWAYSGKDHTVTELDPATGAARRTTAISTVPALPGNSEGPVIAADADAAWVVGHDFWDRAKPCEGGGVLTRVRAGVGGTREYRLKEKPLAVAVADGAVWVVATCVVGTMVLRLDARTGRLLEKVPLPGEVSAGGIAVGEGAVWLLDPGKALLLRIDPHLAAVTATLDLGTSALPPVVGLGSVWVFVSNEGGKLFRVNPRTLRATEAISSVPERAGTFVVADGSLWWNDIGGGSVIRLDPTTGRILSTIRVTPPGQEGVGLVSTAIAAGAGRIWVTVGTGLD